MDEAEYSRRIELLQDDPTALRAIADELQQRQELWAKRLRLRAIQLKIAGGRAPSTAVRSAEPSDLPNWLADYGLPIPTGQPLYRYRLPRSTFDRLQANLAQRSVALRFAPTVPDCALFVLWAAEWFRRCYGGGIQRWDDVGGPIGLSCDWSAWRRLADTGLKRWGIPELRINGTHHRLAAIARQGGFPVAALEGRGGWASRYLQKLVGLLLAEAQPTLELADRHALTLIGTIPDTWRNEEMRIVSAELALEVVRLRREAEAGGAISGSLVSAWLDQHRDGWRSDLPLDVDGEAGRALVDDLMRAVPLKGGSGSIRATRFLTLEAEGFTERLGLTLEGSIAEAAGTGLSRLQQEWSRLRLFPARGFAQHVAGELAVAEADGEGVWRARPATGAPARLKLSFAVAIDAELRGEGRRVCDAFTLPGGEPVADGLRVFSANAEGDEALSDLTFLGGGSGSYRAEPLYLDVPAGWVPAPHGDDASVSERDRGGGGRTLWEARGTVLVTSDRDDVYLVRSGQTGDRRDSLTLVGECPRGCTAADPSLQLFLGTPRFELCEARRPRGPGPNEAWWRPKGESQWRSCCGPVEPGLVEFAWRDAKSGHIRDKRIAIVVPPDFRIERSPAGGRLTLTIIGWPGDIHLDRGAPAGKGSWTFPSGGIGQSWTKAELSGSNSTAAALRIPLPHLAHVAEWEGVSVPRDRRIPLAAMHRHVARTEGSCDLMADLLDRDGRLVSQAKASWCVDGELALSAIRDDVAALLRPLGQIDARVRLNFNDSHDNFWYISEFGFHLGWEAGRLCTSEVITEPARICGRDLAESSTEIDFGPYGLLQDVNYRPISLPTLSGSWIVYLRRDRNVLSRPFYIGGRELAVLPPTPLGSTMSIRDEGERSAAFDALCERLATEPTSDWSRGLLRSIIRLVTSLDGLPPATFDILQRLASRPFLGPLLLFEASPTEVPEIIALADGLPFCWAMIPKRFWDDAAEAQGELLFGLFPDAPESVAMAIGGRRRDIAVLDTALAPLLDLPAPVLPWEDIKQSFLNRSADRIREDTTSPFRPVLAPMLREWGVASHFYRSLDAPIAAARVAQQRTEVGLAEIYCIKDIARRHPRYFREAFAAALRES